MSDQPFIYMGGQQEVPNDIIAAQIHPTVKKIEPNAFADCKELRYVEFSEGLEVIGHRAFYRCVKLTFIRLSKTTKKIEMAAFRLCKKLKYVIFNEELEEIGTSAFAECKALQHLSLSPATRVVNKGAFLGCTGLQKVEFNLGLETVDTGAFSNCKKLKLVVMPSEVPSLMPDAIPDEATIEDTRSEKFWAKVLRSAEEAEADLVTLFVSDKEAPDEEPEDDLADPAHVSELESARAEIEKLKRLVSKLQNEANIGQNDRDKLKKEVATGRQQLEDALTLAEELQEELTFVDEQRQATQELLEKALDQRDELVKAKHEMEEKDQPTIADFKEFEEHINFIEGQAEQTRREFEKTAKECSILLKENAALKRKNKQIERVMELRNKEYMELLGEHVEAKLQIMGAAPESLLVVEASEPVKPAAKSPDTPSKKKKVVKKKKKPCSPSKSSPSKSSPRKVAEDPLNKNKNFVPSIQTPSLAELKPPEPVKELADETSQSKTSTQKPIKAPLKVSNMSTAGRIENSQSETVQELQDDTASESEFGSERDGLLEECKIELIPPVVVAAKEVETDEGSCDASSQKSLDSCHKRIDWVGQIHETTSTSTSNDERCEGALPVLIQSNG